MSFSGFTLPISLNAVATGGGVTPKSMSGLRGKTVYNSSGTSYTLPASGNFSLKDNLLDRSFTSPVNNLSIATAKGVNLYGVESGSYTITPPGRSLSYSIGGLTDIAINFTMTGGNSSPVYIYFNTSPFNGTTAVKVNNVNYGNNGGTAVYFPYGIVNATAVHGACPNGGSITISTDPPSDYSGRNKGYQNAQGNSITWP